MIKILVTLGPNSLSEKTIKKIEKEGVYLFRINMSHTPMNKIEQIITSVQKFTNTPICIDSEGAQLRNNYMKNEDIFYKKNEIIKIHFSEIVGTNHSFSLNHFKGAKQLNVGDKIKIDFNCAEMEVIEVKNDYCLAKVLTEGSVGSNKAVNVNKIINLPAITEKDKEAIQIGKKKGVRNFALSFAGSKIDIKKFRKFAGSGAKIISKIESLKGLYNLDEIIKESDEILIDRGDLSREVKIEKIPFLQRNIIAHAKALKTPVYVATNLLESMIIHNVPNRAEVNDIISTMQMGADGLVLAGETAIGKFPIECVRMIRRLINQYNKWTPNSRIEDIIKI